MTGNEVVDRTATGTRVAAWRGDYDRVAATVRWLDTARPAQPTVAGAAAAQGITPVQLGRSLGRFSGVDPTHFLPWLAADVAVRLRAGPPGATGAATGNASGGPTAAHPQDAVVSFVDDTVVDRRGRGLTIGTGVHPTRLGDLVVATCDRGVLALAFADAAACGHGTAADAVLGTVLARWPDARVVGDEPATLAVAERVRAILDGTSAGEPIEVLVPATALWLEVWRALTRLRPAEVVSYQQLAATIGRPTAVRAVANAVAGNRIAVLVPCHRVVRATGAPGGYRWGSVRKRMLIAREAVHQPHRDPGRDL
jgi:AraC family transcriptional regulator, regulatory protein of adaptative response / methylated-DNA-[protein]-cysteine methyltransferase